MQKQVTAKNGTTAYKGLKIDAITSQFRLQQLIIKPNHLTGNSSSCIDLILSSLSNLVWIVFLKFNLKFFYSSPYERKTWYYNKANTDLIRRSIHEFSCENIFSKTDVNQNVYLFKQTIKNILSNFIPHDTVVCDDRNPPWINNKIKKLIAEKNIASKCYLQTNSYIQLFRRFQSFQNLFTVTLEKSKYHFYCRILKQNLVFHQFIIISKKKLRSITISLLNSAL